MALASQLMSGRWLLRSQHASAVYEFLHDAMMACIELDLDWLVVENVWNEVSWYRLEPVIELVEALEA